MDGIGRRINGHRPDVSPRSRGRRVGERPRPLEEPPHPAAPSARCTWYCGRISILVTFRECSVPTMTSSRRCPGAARPRRVGTRSLPIQRAAPLFFASASQTSCYRGCPAQRRPPLGKAARVEGPSTEIASSAPEKVAVGSRSAQFVPDPGSDAARGWESFTRASVSPHVRCAICGSRGRLRGLSRPIPGRVGHPPLNSQRAQWPQLLTRVGGPAGRKRRAALVAG